MSFFEELKRRNVFRVGIAYAISAWVLLQIVDLVLDNISAPEWVMQVFMLFLAIGFPVALIFAWAFEMTPDGVKLEKDVDRSQSITRKTGQKMNRSITIVLGLAVVFLLADRFMPDTETELQTPTESAVTSADTNLTETTPEKSIAVLPFVDMSPESDQAYFADGISEEILNVLVKTHSLKVAGRTSSFQFRGRNEDLRNIGELLGVENILEGSIRKSNNRVRITAQLVSAKDGFHLWSETYDRELTDIFAIQDEIARAITTALSIELNLADQQQPLVTASTNNMEAYDLYLEAIGMIARRQDFPRIFELLDEAIELDPNFAAGLAAAAQAHALYFYYVKTDNPSVQIDKAESMANQALAIDPSLSMAYSVLGDVHRDRSDWMKAKNSYQRALELNPDYVEANAQYAQMLWRLLYAEEALTYSQKAAELDPLSSVNLTVNAVLLFSTGDRKGAWTEMNKALELGGSGAEFAVRHAVRMALSDGNLERSIKLMKDIAAVEHGFFNTPGVAERFNALIPALESKEKTLSFLSDSVAGNSIHGGISFNWPLETFWAAYYGDYDLAETIMTIGVQEEDQLVGAHDPSWLSYSVLNPLHSSAGFKKLIRNLNIDVFWRENGFPTSCRPLGDDDFACN